MRPSSRLLIGAICAAGLSHAASGAEPTSMKAIVYREFGSPDVLRLEDVEKPVPGDTQLLIKVRAASVNPLDWHYMEGTPYIARPLAFGLRKPVSTRLGVDYAGTVEAVGKSVTRFKPGDDVFGARLGALAEYVCVLETGAVVPKPPELSFEQAAALPVAGLTALQALRDRGGLQPGQSVLINGASGGVGTFAVQIGKTLGATVTGVCSTRNVEMVRSLGADAVVDYTKDDYTRGEARYDVILDNVGNWSLLANRRVLKPAGIYVLVGGGGLNDGRWVKPMIRPLKALLLSRFVDQKMAMMLAEQKQSDLTTLAELVRAGQVTPVIDRRYAFRDAPEAIRYLETGRARGKVVIDLDAATLPSNPAAADIGDRRLGAGLVALVLVGSLVGVTIVPVAAALVLNRRFRRRNPAKRPYRWGYYFALMAVAGGLGIGVMLEFGVIGLIVCGLVYAGLGWLFAERRRWAWVALTILSLNPVAWIINAFYLRKRWSEDA